MKKGATNGNKKKWWIRFLDEKSTNHGNKRDRVDSMLNERENEKHHSGWMSSAALCTGPNFAAQCAVMGGVLETGPRPSGYLSGFIFDTHGYPKDRVPGSDVHLRLSKNQIPIF
jgi:hypothetical protein